jgi:hypothetical protein
MPTYEVHVLRTTLKKITDCKKNPANIDRARTVPYIEAFSDIVPREHLIGKALIPLCCETAFTSINSRANDKIDRGMKLAALSKPTPLLFGTSWRRSEEEKEPLHR